MLNKVKLQIFPVKKFAQFVFFFFFVKFFTQLLTQIFTIMKKTKTIFVSALLCVCPMMMFGQLEVKPNGDTYIAKNVYLESASNFLGTTANNVPITFKVNNNLAGFTGNSGNNNVSFGFGTLSNPLSSSRNTAIGYNVLSINTTGVGNTAIGNNALSVNTTGLANTAIGEVTLSANITGHSNIAIGVAALYQNTIGAFNTANGCYALMYNTIGEFNTAIGTGALSSNTTGNSNTAIGNYADVNSNNLYNATAIGNTAIATASYQVRIGNSSITSIGGQVSWTALSDGRAKKNIRSDVPGLTFINRLQPVMYNLNLDAIDDLLKSDDPKINARRDSIREARSSKEKEIEAEARANKEKIVYTGFIAQDVEKTAKSIGYDFSGIDVPENGKGTYGLRYAEFVVPLVKAVQELSEQVNELKAEIEVLKKNNSADVIFKAKPAQQSDDVFTQQNEDPAVLYQNNPNPFSQSTEIKYYLPASARIASLCIYDLYGKQLKQIRLSQRGNGSQIISGAEFSAGIYLYALIADGKEIDVKRMILTE